MKLSCQERTIYCLLSQIWTIYYCLESLISQAVLQKVEEMNEYIFFHVHAGVISSRA